MHLQDTTMYNIRPFNLFLGFASRGGIHSGVLHLGKLSVLFGADGSLMYDMKKIR